MTDDGTQDPVRIFVGTDQVQRLAVDVLAFSIRRHTHSPVNVRSLENVTLPTSSGKGSSSRTGFSFARFAIPELAGRRGRAIYLDADMLVFRDVRELWGLPFAGAKVLLQDDPPQAESARKRIKQTAVMVMDCAALDWDARAIVRGVGRDYTYEQLMQQLCILRSSDIRHAIPAHWNSLEYYDESTSLIHFTDMLTQPWVSPFNRNGWLWTAEVRRMLEAGALDWKRVEEEVAKGHFRPSLLTELRQVAGKRPVTEEVMAELATEDRKAGYIAHRHLNRHSSPLVRVRRAVGGLLRQAGLR